SRLFVRKRAAFPERILPSGAKVAALLLPFEPVAVAHSIFAFDPVDFARADPARPKRRLAHHDGALEQLALGQHQVEAAKLDQLPPVEHPDHDRSLREGFEHGLHRAPSQLSILIVVAEGDHLRGFGAGCAEKVDPKSVAVIDLRPELPGELDLCRLLVDDRDSDALGLKHLRDGLPEPAVTDDDGAGLGRELRSVEAVTAAYLA